MGVKLTNAYKIGGKLYEDLYLTARCSSAIEPTKGNKRYKGVLQVQLFDDLATFEAYSLAKSTGLPTDIRPLDTQIIHLSEDPEIEKDVWDYVVGVGSCPPGFTPPVTTPANLKEWFYWAISHQTKWQGTAWNS